MTSIDRRLGRFNHHEQPDDDQPCPNWKPLSVVIRRAARRIPRPLPTALVLLEQAGINIKAD